MSKLVPNISDVIVGDDLSGFKNGNVLLHDLVCLHTILWQSKKLSEIQNPLSDTQIDELSRHLYQLLTHGHDLILPNAAGVPKSFLNKKDPNDGGDEKQCLRRFLVHSSTSNNGQREWKELDESQAVEFVSKVIRIGISAKEAEDLSVTIKALRTQGLSFPPVSSGRVIPEEFDILTLKRGMPVDEEVKPGSGNTRFIDLAYQYIRTSKESDLLSTGTSVKRAEASITIMDLSREPVEPPSRSAKKGPTRARFLVRDQEDWLEIDRKMAAELSLLVLFDKFVEGGCGPTSEYLQEQSEKISGPGTTPIEEIAQFDVLFGRGGLTNNHCGNRRFRDIIALHRPDYARAIKIEKPNVARRIVKGVRLGSPPGRFLKKSEDGKWYDVGDRHASEKTSQALREKTRQEKQERMVQKTTGESKQKRDSNEIQPSSPNDKRPRMHNAAAATAAPNNFAMMAPPYFGMPQPQGMIPPGQYGPYGMALRIPNAPPHLQQAAAPPNGTDNTQTDSSQSTSQATTVPIPPGGLPSAQPPAQLETKNNVDESIGHGTSEVKGDLLNFPNTAYVLPIEEPAAPHRPYDENGNILVTDHDILCGRGGLTNHHKGNKRFRDVVSLHRPDYVRAAKVQKPAVARLIVAAIRSGNPPGRFLKKDEKSGKWYDIGDKLAAEKASQALREKPSEEKQPKESNEAGAPLVPRLPVPFYTPYNPMVSGVAPPQSVMYPPPPQNIIQPAPPADTAALTTTPENESPQKTVEL